jgi:pilus assembly protein CpaF
MRDGSRKVTRITEVQGIEGDNVTLQDIFMFQAVAIAETADKVEGTLKPTGMRPKFSPRLERAGFKLSGDIFGANMAEMAAGPQRKRGEKATCQSSRFKNSITLEPW